MIDERLVRALIFGGLVLGWIAQEHGWLSRLRQTLRVRRTSAWNRRNSGLPAPDKACTRGGVTQ